MMTEEEAKTKWCPFARYIGDTRDRTSAHNRVGSGDGFNSECNCIASQCMAWRWAYRDEIHVPEGMAIPAGYYAFATMTSSSGGNVTKFNVCRLERREHDGEVAPQRGCCGMAGDSR